MGKDIDGFKRKGEIGMINIFSDYNFKNIKLLSACIVRDSDGNGRYLCLTYEGIDKNGNEYMIVIPKICLPFININTFPWICEERDCHSETLDDVYIQLADDKLEILTSSGTVYDYNGKAVEYTDAKIIIIPKKNDIPKKMTLSEIEKELGYKIELVEEKQCCETCKFQSILCVKEPCNKCRKYDKWESK